MNPSPHILIEAGPGSGKTFTLLKAYDFMQTGQYNFKPTQEQATICYAVSKLGPISPSSVVFIAFNVAIKEELDSQLPDQTKAYTFGGLGQSIVYKKHGFQQLDRNRSEQIISKLTGKRLQDEPYTKRMDYFTTITYIRHLKEELRAPTLDNLHFIQQKYGLEYIPQDMDLLTRAMTEMTRPTGSYEFIDQVWMGVNCLTKPIYDIAFIDEAQDLSSLRLEFALRVAKTCIFCGDPYQSINAFAGADLEAFEKLRRVCGIQLELKTCFRCPPNHIDHANKIRPARITPFKTEPGPIVRKELSALPEFILDILNSHSYPFVRPPTDSSSDSPPPVVPPLVVPPEARDLSNHLMISRTNAALFRAGIFLLKNRIPVHLLKRKDEENIQTILIEHLNKLKCNTLPALTERLNKDILKSSSLSFKQGSRLLDISKCLLYLSKEANAVSQIPSLIEALTSDKTGSLKLSTIHKAKGLEAQCIYILFPPVPHPRATSPQEKEQERNLEFVSETRSKWLKCYVIE